MRALVGSSSLSTVEGRPEDFGTNEANQERRAPTASNMPTPSRELDAFCKRFASTDQDLSVTEHGHFRFNQHNRGLKAARVRIHRGCELDASD